MSLPIPNGNGLLRKRTKLRWNSLSVLQCCAVGPISAPGTPLHGITPHPVLGLGTRPGRWIQRPKNRRRMSTPSPGALRHLAKRTPTLFFQAVGPISAPGTPITGLLHTRGWDWEHGLEGGFSAPRIGDVCLHPLLGLSGTSPRERRRSFSRPWDQFQHRGHHNGAMKNAIGPRTVPNPLTHKR